jgi:hypothetical protein
VNINSRWNSSSFSENFSSFDVYFPIDLYNKQSLENRNLYKDRLVDFILLRNRRLTIVRFSNGGRDSGISITLLIAIGDESTRNYSGKRCRKIER